MPKYEQGEEISYTIEVLPDSLSKLQANGYSVETAGFGENGWSIIASRAPEIISISGSIVWLDDNNKDGSRPEYVFVHIIDGDYDGIAAVFPGEDGKWKWEINDLIRRRNGKDIGYVVNEDRINGYTTVISGSIKDGFTITNTRNKDVPSDDDHDDIQAQPASADAAVKPAVQTISIRGTIIWVDNDNKEGLRPDFVTLRISNAEIFEKAHNAFEGKDGSWAWEVKGLSKTIAGKTAVYTVSADTIKNYRSDIRYDKEKGYIITNHLDDPIYTFNKGNSPYWIIGSQDSLSFTIRRSYNNDKAIDHFTGIRIDGQTVQTSSYELSDGIELNSAYLQTLNEGTHVLRADFDDGYAEISFTIWTDESSAEKKRNSFCRFASLVYCAACPDFADDRHVGVCIDCNTASQGR